MHFDFCFMCQSIFAASFCTLSKFGMDLLSAYQPSCFPYVSCNSTSQVSFPLSFSPRPSLISEQFVCSASSVLLAGFICDSWKNEAPRRRPRGRERVRLVLDCVLYTVSYFERLVREISNKPSENDTALRISNLPSYRLDVALRNALTNAHLVHTKVRTNRASSK